MNAEQRAGFGHELGGIKGFAECLCRWYVDRVRLDQVRLRSMDWRFKWDSEKKNLFATRRNVLNKEVCATSLGG